MRKNNKIQHRQIKQLKLLFGCNISLQYPKFSVEDKLKIAFFNFNNNDSHIVQGDLLSLKNLDIEIDKLTKTKISETVYPYFFKTYSLGVVVNATCDLVHGEGRNPTRCVHLLAVAPFDPVLDEIAKASEFSDLGFCDEEIFRKLRDKVRKRIDGQDDSVFFLPAPMVGGLNSPLAVKLDVGVSIRYQQFDAFTNARIGVRLSALRASKLAENYGNLFNRIALDDVSSILGKSLFDNWLDNEVMGRRIIKVANPIYDASKSELKQLNKDKTKTQEERRVLGKAILLSHKGASDIKEMTTILEQIKNALNNSGINENSSSKVLDRLRNDSNFKRIITKARKSGN